MWWESLSWKGILIDVLSFCIKFLNLIILMFPLSWSLTIELNGEKHSANLLNTAYSIQHVAEISKLLVQIRFSVLMPTIVYHIWVTKKA